MDTNIDDDLKSKETDNIFSLARLGLLKALVHVDLALNPMAPFIFAERYR